MTTIDNDLSSNTAGQFVAVKAMDFLEFAKSERDLPVELRELANVMTREERRFTIEWLSDALSAVLAVDRAKYVDEGFEFLGRHGE